MKHFLLLSAITALLVSCGSDYNECTVKQYHLRERMFAETNNAMARGEVQRFLHGSVSSAERKNKIGQYYHLIWNQAPIGELEVIFSYQQAGTGSKILREVRKIRGPKINEYFAVNGYSYSKKGRVLAWKIAVCKNGKELASKQSYMWR